MARISLVNVLVIIPLVGHWPEVLDTPVEYEPGPCHANTLVITVIVREYKRYMSYLLTLTNYRFMLLTPRT